MSGGQNGVSPMFHDFSIFSATSDKNACKQLFCFASVVTVFLGTRLRTPYFQVFSATARIRRRPYCNDQRQPKRDDRPRFVSRRKACLFSEHPNTMPTSNVLSRLTDAKTMRIQSKACNPNSVEMRQLQLCLSYFR